MDIKNHPNFGIWKEAFLQLIEAIHAQKCGQASAEDVAKALDVYLKVVKDD